MDRNLYETRRESQTRLPFLCNQTIFSDYLLWSSEKRFSCRLRWVLRLATGRSTNAFSLRWSLSSWTNYVLERHSTPKVRFFVAVKQTFDMIVLFILARKLFVRPSPSTWFCNRDAVRILSDGPEFIRKTPGVADKVTFFVWILYSGLLSGIVRDEETNRWCCYLCVTKRRIDGVVTFAGTSQ